LKEDILNKLENIKEVKMENKNKEYLLKIIQLHDYIKKKKNNRRDNKRNRK
jgi:hypothetical protein